MYLNEQDFMILRSFLASNFSTPELLEFMRTQLRNSLNDLNTTSVSYDTVGKVIEYVDIRGYLPELIRALLEKFPEEAALAELRTRYPRHLTKEYVQQKLNELETLPPASTAATSDSEWAYHEAAAVLSYFELDSLKPFTQEQKVSRSSIGRLLVDSTLVTDAENRSRWMLRNDVRQQALVRLADRGALLEALDANQPLPDDNLQQALTGYLTGKAPPLEEQDLGQLINSLQAVEWLQVALKDLPSTEEIQRRIELQNLLQPFRNLVGSHFRGREKELARLSDYVEYLPPSTAVKSIERQIRGFFSSLHDRPPLLIYGPGGVGKSTLVSKFILNHIQDFEEIQLSFAYIDFDRPGLVAEEPLTLLAEIVRQFGTQYPQIEGQCNDLQQQLLREITLVQRGTTEAPYLEPITQRLIQSAPRRISDRSPFLAEFKTLVDKTDAQSYPFLLVLDTFEVVQYRSRDFVSELFEFLGELQQYIERLRTVLAGRAPITEFKYEPLPLGDLDKDAALGYLLARGVKDKELAAVVVGQVGGNPLSLYLASEVLRIEKTGQRGIEDLRSRRSIFLKVQENRIQGQLYRRILNHIEDPQVRRLAHPGLVLREVTPDLILDVLAEPCRVEVTSLKQAEDLFNEFARQVTLVEQVDDHTVRHRADVRRIMLEALRQDEPFKALKIHRGAVQFYNMQSDAHAKVEEIYHRLFVDQDFIQVDKIWDDLLAGGAAEFLESLREAVDEVPPPARAHLASRFNMDIPDIDWNVSDQQSWERRAEQRARDLVSLQRPEQALEMLAERGDKRLDSSPLYLLEAQILMQLERWAEARRVVKEGIYSFYHAGTVSKAVELCMLGAQLDEKIGAYEQSREMLNKVEELLDSSDQARHLEVNLGRVRLDRLSPPELEEQALEREEAVLRQLNDLSDQYLADHPQLRRDVMHVFADSPVLQHRFQSRAENEPPSGKKDTRISFAADLTAQYRNALLRLFRLSGLGALNDDQRHALAAAIAAWDALASVDATRSGLLARSANIPFKADVYQAWADFMLMASPSHISSVLLLLLEKFPAPVSVVRLLLEMLQFVPPDYSMAA